MTSHYTQPAMPKGNPVPLLIAILVIVLMCLAVTSDCATGGDKCCPRSALKNQRKQLHRFEVGHGKYIRPIRRHKTHF